MSSLTKAAAVCAAALFMTAVASTAEAQGKGKGNGNAWGRGRSGSPSAASSSVEGEGGAILYPAGTGVRNFGAWLDDASIMPPGMGWTTVSFGYFRTPLAREIDVPMIDGGVALAKRLQVGVSVPVYHAGAPGEPVSRGLGDLYLNAKFQLRDPSGGGVGLAVIPVLEVLSFEPRPGESRLQWGLPLSAELQQERWRLFGSAGYFSRGALFAALGSEFALGERMWLVASVTESHSIYKDDLSAALGYTKSRTDVNLGLSVAPTSNISIFGSAGRTVSKRDDSSTVLSITAGLSYSFTAWEK